MKNVLMNSFSRISDFTQNWQKMILMIRNTEGNFAFFFKSGQKNGHFLYKGFFLSAPTTVLWNSHNSQWEVSLKHKGEEMIIFYSAAENGMEAPSGNGIVWKSRHSCCSLDYLSSVESFFSKEKAPSAV